MFELSDLMCHPYALSTQMAHNLVLNNLSSAPLYFWDCQLSYLIFMENAGQL